MRLHRRRNQAGRSGWRICLTASAIDLGLRGLMRPNFSDRHVDALDSSSRQKPSVHVLLAEQRLSSFAN
jgi:hypothetical protein